MWEASCCLRAVVFLQFPAVRGPGLGVDVHASMTSLLLRVHLRSTCQSLSSPGRERERPRQVQRTKRRDHRRDLSGALTCSASEDEGPARCAKTDRGIETERQAGTSTGRHGCRKRERGNDRERDIERANIENAQTPARAGAETCRNVMETSFDDYRDN